MTSRPERPLIAVDAMGGDFGPDVVVPGVVAALRAGERCAVALYGDEARVQAALAAAGAGDLALEIVPCSQDIPMDAAPAAAIRSKPDSPIVRAMQDHRAGKVQAVISAGSTGAMVAASLLILGRLTTAERPAIGTFIPTLAGETLMVDAGANVQCTPALLVSFARMGELYSRLIQGTPRPRVGLLNIGGEPGKGSELTVAAHAQLRATDLDFVGNVESNELLLGACDVLVTDGYTGNVVLKQVEGIATFLAGLAKLDGVTDEERASLRTLLGLIQRRFTYEVYGGAPLLGVAGVSVICHGRSTSLAFQHAVAVALRQISVDLPGQLQQALAAAHSAEGDA